MRNLLLAASALAFATITTPASAAIQNVPVPTTNYITFGGVDWAWASPCSPGGCYSGAEIDMSYQSTQGWRIATAADLLTGPAPSDFLDGSGNVICASNWFTNLFTHCDYSDGTGGYIWNAPGPNGQNAAAETWVLRDGNGAVPEAATWALLIAGFGLVGTALRRRTPATA